MKIGRRAEGRVKSTKPDKNNSKKNLVLGAVLAITVVLIVWVYSMGRKAEQVVSVVMLNENVYKNQVITESVLKEYQMLSGEFEKYAIQDSNGTIRRRIVLWEERGKIINSFAAYPLQKDTVAMYNNFITSRTDNSDTVLYSFPGKEIVSFEIGESDLDAFKTFLQPGDRINITAVFKVQEDVYIDDGNGNVERQQVETQKQEVAFKDVMLADLLNSRGDSILDLFTEYNDKTTYQQAALDASDSWREQTEPNAMLVALTPEEVTRYYEYLNKDAEFYMSLPQRIE